MHIISHIKCKRIHRPLRKERKLIILRGTVANVSSMGIDIGFPAFKKLDYSMLKGRHFDKSVILLCVRWYDLQSEPSQSERNDGRARHRNGPFQDAPLGFAFQPHAASHRNCSGELLARHIQKTCAKTAEKITPDFSSSSAVVKISRV